MRRRVWLYRDVIYRGLAAAAASSRVLEASSIVMTYSSEAVEDAHPGAAPYNRACTRRTIRCSPSW